MIIKEDFTITSILLSILFVGVLFCAIPHYWNKRWLVYHGFTIQGPFAIPFIGNPTYLVKLALNGAYDVCFELCKKYPQFSKLWIGHHLFILMYGGEYVNLVLKNCLERGHVYEYFKVAFGEGLLTASVEKWKRSRKLVNLTFSQTILNSYVDIFAKHAKKLRDDLMECENTQIDMFPKFCLSTSAIISETAMGVDPTELKEENQSCLTWFMRGEELVSKRMYNPFLQLDFIWKLTEAAKEVDYLSTKTRNFARHIIEARRRELLSNEEADPCKKQCFLDYLIKITDEDGKWTIEELIDEVTIIFIAGSDTTAAAQSFVMLMLAIHPEVQEKVYDELSTIFGNSDRDADVYDLERMVYLEQVIKETLRLFPVVPMFVRSVQEDFTLGSNVIPKGANVAIPIAFIHRNPESWHDPLKFEPDRFLPEQIKKRPPGAYIPFGIAPRNCIGLKFAMMSMKVTVSTILRHYKIISSQYSSVTDIKLDLVLLLHAKNGYGVILQRR